MCRRPSAGDTEDQAWTRENGEAVKTDGRWITCVFARDGLLCTSAVTFCTRRSRSDTLLSLRLQVGWTRDVRLPFTFFRRDKRDKRDFGDFV